MAGANAKTLRSATAGDRPAAVTEACQRHERPWRASRFAMKPILFTSLAPRNLAHQLDCMASWRDRVSAIVSVNHQAEAQEFADLPGWIEPYTYDAALENGQFRVPLQKMGEAVAALARPADPVVLCNSDIRLAPAKEPLAALADTDGLNYLSRIDLHGAGRPPSVYDEGFDVFFFRARRHELLPELPFRMGLPWWDFYLPLRTLSAGLPLRRLQPGLAQHRAHAQNWDWESFIHIAQALLQKLFPEFAEPVRDRQEALQLCGIVRQHLVSRRTGECYTAADLQGLKQRLQRWHRQRSDPTRANPYHRLTQLKLYRRGANLIHYFRRTTHFRFRMDDGEIVTTRVFLSARNDWPKSVFVFGMHKGGSSLLHNLCRDALACKHMLVTEPPHDIERQGRYFFRVQEDMDGLYERPGYCFTAFRGFPDFLRNNRPFAGSPKILLVRDPRDMLVSAYFSWGLSHRLPNDPRDRAYWLRLREHYQVQSIDEFALQQAGAALKQYMDYLWMLEHTDDHLVLRYEDVVFDKARLMRVLTERLEIDLTLAQRRRLLAMHDIRPDQENPGAHIRKVAPGDHLEKLQPDTIVRLDQIFQPVYRKFGYGPGGAETWAMPAQWRGQPDRRVAAVPHLRKTSP